MQMWWRSIVFWATQYGYLCTWLSKTLKLIILSLHHNRIFLSYSENNCVTRLWYYWFSSIYIMKFSLYCISAFLWLNCWRQILNQRYEMKNDTLTLQSEVHLSVISNLGGSSYQSSEYLANSNILYFYIFLLLLLIKISQIKTINLFLRQNASV